MKLYHSTVPINIQTTLSEIPSGEGCIVVSGSPKYYLATALIVDGARLIVDLATGDTYNYDMNTIVEPIKLSANVVRTKP